MDYSYSIPQEIFTKLKAGQTSITFNLQDGINEGLVTPVPILALHQGDTVKFDMYIPPGVNYVTWVSEYDSRMVMISTNENRESGREEALYPWGYEQMDPKPPAETIPPIKLGTSAQFSIRPLKDLTITNILVTFFLADVALYTSWVEGGSPPPITDYVELEHELEGDIMVCRYSDMPQGQYRILVPKGTRAFEFRSTLNAGQESSNAYASFDKLPDRDTAVQILDPTLTLQSLWDGDSFVSTAPGNTYELRLSLNKFDTFVADRSRWLYVDLSLPNGNAVNTQSRLTVLDYVETNIPGTEDYVPPPIVPYPTPQKPSMDFPGMLPFGDLFPPKTPNTKYITSALQLAEAGNMMKDPLKNICVTAEAGLESVIDNIAASPLRGAINFSELHNQVMSFGSFSKDMQTISGQMFGNIGDKPMIDMPYSLARNASHLIGTKIPTANAVLSIAQYQQTSDYYGERTLDSCAAIRNMAGGLIQMGSDALGKISEITNSISSIISQVGASISKITSMVGAAVAKLNQAVSNMISGAMGCIQNIASAMTQMVREAMAGMIRSLSQFNPCTSSLFKGDGIAGTPGILSDEMNSLVDSVPMQFTIDDKVDDNFDDNLKSYNDPTSPDYIPDL